MWNYKHFQKVNLNKKVFDQQLRLFLLDLYKKEQYQNKLNFYSYQNYNLLK